MITPENQIAENENRSWLLMTLFVGLVIVLGYGLGGLSGSGPSVFWLALIFSIVSVAGSYYFSDRFLLAISRARRIEEKDNPDLFRLIQETSRQANLPRPQVFLMAEEAPNAFATGRDPTHASVCLTTGIIRKLSEPELKGVVAHELAHVRNLDIRFMSLVAVLVGLVSLISDWLLRSLFWGPRREEAEGRRAGQLVTLLAVFLALLSPLAAVLIQLAISRRREFLADATAASLTHQPKELASALEKIAGDRKPLSVASEATAHLFIADPFKGRSFSHWFSTHPPVAERIRILRAL